MGGLRPGFARTLKLIAFALVPAVVLLVLAETYATFAIARKVTTEKDPVSGETRYTLEIGRFPWSRQSVTPLNSGGFPDAEFPTGPKQDGCVHIVFAGDSFVFGDGVDSDSSFVGLLRTWTEADSDRCIRVFNLGERGTTITGQARRVRETLPQLQPDIVILGQYQNDLTGLLEEERERRVHAQPVPTQTEVVFKDVRERIGAMNLNLVRLLTYQAFGSAIRHDVHYDLLRHWSVIADSSQQETATRLMAEYTAEYDSLVGELSSRGIAFGVVILPSKLDLLAGRYPEEPFFVSLAEARGVPYLRTFPVLDSNRSPYPFLMYDGHLNEAGNRVIANAIRDWLFVATPAPFAALRDTVSYATNGTAAQRN